MKTFKSSRLLALWRVTKVIFPDRLEVKDGKVYITKKRWFGLITDSDSLTTERVASVRVKNSLLSSKVYVETMGGAKQDFSMERLWKGTAKEMAKALES